MNKMDEKEQNFKRKAFGVVDSGKEMELMQGPFKPSKAILATPISGPDVIIAFCDRCGDYSLLNARGVMLLEILLELRHREDEKPKDTDGYFVELEICPVCNPQNDSMEFRFRKISDVED